MVGQDDYDANPFAAPESDLNQPFDEKCTCQFVYAGFGRRLMAMLIDYCVLSFISCFVWVFIFPIFMMQNQIILIGPIEGFLAQQIIGLIIGWLYCALHESSAIQATFAKKLCGIRVLSLKGETASFGQATVRYFSKLLSGLVLGFGYLQQPFTERRQALHDQMSGCVVVLT